jgi:hypothetical protein
VQNNIDSYDYLAMWISLVAIAKNIELDHAFPMAGI